MTPLPPPRDRIPAAPPPTHPPHPAGPPLPLLSQLAVLPRNLPDSPSALPPGWSLIEAPRLRKFGCYGPQYLALGARMNPAGRLCSGSWDVVYLNEPRGGRLAGLGEGLRVLLSLDDGAYCNLDFVHVQQVREPRRRRRWGPGWGGMGRGGPAGPAAGNSGGGRQPWGHAGTWEARACGEGVQLQQGRGRGGAACR